jgi:tol-pal system protein YbgF
MRSSHGGQTDDMKFLKRIFFSVPVLILFGCATVDEKELPPITQELQIVELKKSTAETNVRLEELNNKFLLLQEKVAANTEKLEDLSGKVTTVVPPEDLRVIKLKEEEAVEGKPEPNPEALYSLGQDLFMAGRYERAIEVLSSVAEKFPEHGLADNSLYWMGESYYSLKDFARALANFQQVVDRYPEGNKAPDAMLKLGYSYMELKEIENGSKVLKRVLIEYPESEVAIKARKRLEEIPK